MPVFKHGAAMAILSGAALVAAGPVVADTRHVAYDAADRITHSLTRGVTFEVERGMFGAQRLRGLFSTSARGSASFTQGGPAEVRAALPSGTPEAIVYGIKREGDGAALARALCPGSDETWFVSGRVRAGQPLVLHAVGRWSDGAYRLCVTLRYTYRGDWAGPPGTSVVIPE